MARQPRRERQTRLSRTLGRPGGPQGVSPPGNGYELEPGPVEHSPATRNSGASARARPAPLSQPPVDRDLDHQPQLARSRARSGSRTTSAASAKSPTPGGRIGPPSPGRATPRSGSSTRPGPCSITRAAASATSIISTPTLTFSRCRNARSGFQRVEQERRHAADCASSSGRPWKYSFLRGRWGMQAGSSEPLVTEVLRPYLGLPSLCARNRRVSACDPKAKFQGGMAYGQWDQDPVIDFCPALSEAASTLHPEYLPELADLGNQRRHDPLGLRLRLGRLPQRTPAEQGARRESSRWAPSSQGRAAFTYQCVEGFHQAVSTGRCGRLPGRRRLDGRQRTDPRLDRRGQATSSRPRTIRSSAGQEVDKQARPDQRRTHAPGFHLSLPMSGSTARMSSNSMEAARSTRPGHLFVPLQFRVPDLRANQVPRGQ